ncbi:hypothetical protein KGA66_01925 [Actinocrinis puniceicyclus]|uniref:Uncharacterized protein n=1 Tax=Actinocrinis puniceicyclus TaxID=977794 RepID=A0A8J7WLP9_9ACTN|nr:hypothetical protein [Actinocrinis puniceicyclus]MBS2961789.1 hypothetical protein [Actinocrinis puniceicyclus]
MYEYEDGFRARAPQRPRTQETPADEHDARAQARRALQDAYDWRDDEPRAAAADTSPATSSTSAARAAARRDRREVTRSISRTAGV